MNHVSLGSLVTTSELAATDHHPPIAALTPIIESFFSAEAFQPWRLGHYYSVEKTIADSVSRTLYSVAPVNPALVVDAKAPLLGPFFYFFSPPFLRFFSLRKGNKDREDKVLLGAGLRIGQ